MPATSPHIAIYVVAAVAIGGAITRPWRSNEAWWAVAGAVALVVFGRLPQGDAITAVDLQALRDWMAAMTVRLAGVRLLDTLIHELSTGDWRRVPKGFRCAK